MPNTYPSSSSDPVLFVALSYVWGPLPDGPDTKDRHHVEQTERVVEDAMRVTIALGYKYLWVDRHCIIQENQSMRATQPRAMNAVYQMAQVTIIAAAGQDSSFGPPGGSIGCVRKPQLSGRVNGHVLAAIPSEPCYQIEDSAWWTRGWTYQEGVLSRRRLVFTEHEVSYECAGMLAREAPRAALAHPQDGRLGGRTADGPTSFPPRTASGAQALVSGPGYVEYTARRLTYDSDILNAMLGVMQAFAGYIRRTSPTFAESRSSAGKNDVGRIPPGNILTLSSNVLPMASAGRWQDPEPDASGFPSWSWTG